MIFSEIITGLPQGTVIYIRGSIVNIASALQTDSSVWPHTAQNILLWNVELSLNVSFLWF